MKRVQRRLIALAFCLFALAMPATAAPTASDFVVTLAGQAVDELRRANVDPAEREDQFRHLLLKGFDLDTIARFVIGRHWRTATPAQQQRYRGIFPDYVVKVLARHAPTYTGETLDIVQEMKVEPEGDMLVRARVQRGEGPIARVDFRVRQTRDGLRIIDVVVEGISLLTTQRAEFDAIVGREGVDGLLATMEAALH